MDTPSSLTWSRTRSTHDVHTDNGWARSVWRETVAALGRRGPLLALELLQCHLVLLDVLDDII